MLTRWTLENFKPIRERLDLPTAPLTVLAGLNSSGKSSFLQSILLIAQTLANQKLDEPLVLNGSFVRFGTFQDVCNDKAKEQQIRIGFTLESGENDRLLFANIDVLFEGNASREEEGHGLQAVRAALHEVKMTIGSPPLDVFIRRAAQDEESSFIHGVASDGLHMLPYPLGQNYVAEHRWKYLVREFPPFVQFAHMVPQRYVYRVELPAADLPKDSLYTHKLVHVSNPIQTSVNTAAQHIITTFSSAIRYLGPLRADPYAIQSYSPSGQPDDVGPRGEYAAAVYAANRKQPIRFWRPDTQQIETATLEEAMDVWLRYLGVADHVSTREAAVPGVAWSVRSGPATRDRPLQAVGVGVSQVLPILVAGLLAPEGTILIMEQPELHLHERPQARLGDFFYGLTRVGKQVFVETHSAVLINQLRYLMVKRGQEAREAIAIYFVNQDEQGDAHFDPIRIAKGGAVENWPDGFFDESFRQEDRITQEGLRARGKRENA